MYDVVAPGFSTPLSNTAGEVGSLLVTVCCKLSTLSTQTSVSPALMVMVVALGQDRRYVRGGASVVDVVVVGVDVEVETPVAVHDKVTIRMMSSACMSAIGVRISSQ